MATLIAERPVPGLEVVDLGRVRPRELVHLWEREIRLWREVLGWDVSDAVRGLSRAVDRGGLLGKVARSGGEALGYTYFGVEGSRAVISGLVVPPHRGAEVGEALVDALLEDVGRLRVRRVETQFLCFESEWLAPCFESHGFDTHWREFLRLDLDRVSSRSPSADGFLLLPWSGWNLSEMAHLMEQAHRGGLDATVNELYRTADGCRLLLNNIARQRGCGEPLVSASAIGRDGATDRAAGFALVTEIASRHGHLAQIAVAPPFQGRGVGRLLLQHVMRQLAASDFSTLSLMFSNGNERAASLYRGAGFETAHRFPVFTRES